MRISDWSSDLCSSDLEMAAAPHFFGNTEVTYKPHYIKGLRISVEGQKVGKYYMDDMQRYTYDGYGVINVRAGYQWGPAELWVTDINLFDTYYATRAQASANGYTSNLGYTITFT